MPASPTGSPTKKTTKPKQQKPTSFPSPQTPRTKTPLRSRTTAQEDQATKNGLLYAAGRAAGGVGTEVAGGEPGSPFRLRTRTVAENRAADRNAGKAKPPKKASPAPKTTPSDAVTAPRTGGGAPTTGVPASAPQTGAQAPKTGTGSGSKKGATATSGGSGASTPAAAPGSAAVDKAPEYPTINWDEYFNPAKRALESSQKANESRRTQNVADWQAFNSWMESKRAEAGSALASQNAAIASSGLEAQKAAIDASVKAAGGNADLLRNAGATTTMANAGLAQSGLINQQSAEQNYIKNQQDVNAARSARQLSNINNIYNTNAAQIRDKGIELDQTIAGKKAQDVMDKYKSDAATFAAQKQYELDQQAAEFLNTLKTGELEVKQYQAQTERIKVKNEATAKQRALQLSLLVEQGKMTRSAADRQLKKEIATAKLTEAAADRATRVLIAGVNKNRTDMAKVQTWAQTWKANTLSGDFAGDSFNKLSTDDQNAVMNRSLTALKGAYPNLKRAQVYTILGSLFGDKGSTLRSRADALWTA